MASASCRWHRLELISSRKVHRGIPCRPAGFASPARIHQYGSDRGYPAWIRTKNNASKGRCVTVTPRGISKGDLRLAILNQTAIGKNAERTWIRTKNNPESFRGCVTVTPRGTRIWSLDSRISPPAQFPKCSRVTAKTPVLRQLSGGHSFPKANAEQLAGQIKVE